jgi:hypothetical protein
MRLTQVYISIEQYPTIRNNLQIQDKRVTSQPKEKKKENKMKTSPSNLQFMGTQEHATPVLECTEDPRA